jgi:hypothetical protein
MGPAFCELIALAMMEMRTRSTSQLIRIHEIRIFSQVSTVPINRFAIFL